MTARHILRTEILGRLATFERRYGALPGLQLARRRQVLVEQLVDSVRRVEYVYTIRSREISIERCNPHRALFDPIRAAVWHGRAGQLEEACWLVFIATHCGKHHRDGWELARQLYAGPREGEEWTWQRIAVDTLSFREWLIERNREWSQSGNPPRFGNHRKFESRQSDHAGAVVESYVSWVLSAGDHATLISEARTDADFDETRAFDILYSSMSRVRRFGRLARFDYLTMLQKCGLATISPPHPYLASSSGPRNGAALLFNTDEPARLNDASANLAKSINVSMQSIEDALCNWAKSPESYKRFLG